MNVEVTNIVHQVQRDAEVVKVKRNFVCHLRTNRVVQQLRLERKRIIETNIEIAYDVEINTHREVSVFRILTDSVSEVEACLETTANAFCIRTGREINRHHCRYTNPFLKLVWFG